MGALGEGEARAVLLKWIFGVRDRETGSKEEAERKDKHTRKPFRGRESPIPRPCPDIEDASSVRWDAAEGDVVVEDVQVDLVEDAEAGLLRFVARHEVRLVGVQTAVLEDGLRRGRFERCG